MEERNTYIVSNVRVDIHILFIRVDCMETGGEWRQLHVPRIDT